MTDYQNIIQRIVEETGQNIEAIEARVQQKVEQLSDLVSKEGAAHIVANELGVKVYSQEAKQKYKVNELKPGLRNVEALLKIIQKYETRTFTRNDKQGKVSSMLTGDETGMVRVVLWDDPMIEQNEKSKENDTILITNAYVKENNGFKEIHVGNRSTFEINPAGQTVGVVNAQKKEPNNYELKKLASLKPGDNARLSGTIVQLYEPKFYPACPTCNKKVVDGKCPSHGSVTHVFVPILNFVLDDGSENLRVVCFRDTVEQVLGINKTAVDNLRTNPADFQEYLRTIPGKQYNITGRATRNEMYDRVEVTANTVEPLNVHAALQELL